MKVECPCGEWHDFSPTMCLMVIDGFVKGDLQVVTGKSGVTVQCLDIAMTPERIKDFERRYPGHRVVAKKEDENG